MQTIPADILARFDDSLKHRNVPLFLRSEYRKWLRYFLDFRAKYPLPYERSVQVKLFADKLRSKGQSDMQVEQAADAVSLFFASQQKQQNCPLSIRKEAHSHAVVRNAPATTRDQGCPSQPLPSKQAADMACEPVGLPAPFEPVASRKGKYDDWRCLRESGRCRAKPLKS